MGLGMPFKLPIFDSVIAKEAERESRIILSSMAALRAPANRSALSIKEHNIMRNIGCATGNYTPDLSPHIQWQEAQRAMHAFYKQATKRKGVKFNAE